MLNTKYKKSGDYPIIETSPDIFPYFFGKAFILSCIPFFLSAIFNRV